MNTLAYQIIKKIKPFGFRRLDDEPKHRWISSIWTDGAGWEIHGKAGTQRYIGYSKREAIIRYNALCRAK